MAIAISIVVALLIGLVGTGFALYLADKVSDLFKGSKIGDEFSLILMFFCIIGIWYCVFAYEYNYITLLYHSNKYIKNNTFTTGEKKEAIEKPYVVIRYNSRNGVRLVGYSESMFRIKNNKNNIKTIIAARDTFAHSRTYYKGKSEAEVEVYDVDLSFYYIENGGLMKDKITNKYGFSHTTPGSRKEKMTDSAIRDICKDRYKSQ